MNIPPGEADRLSLLDYEELLWNWNEMHERDEESDSEPFDRERARLMVDMVKANPLLTH